MLKEGRGRKGGSTSSAVGLALYADIGLTIQEGGKRTIYKPEDVSTEAFLDSYRIGITGFESTSDVLLADDGHGVNVNVARVSRVFWSFAVVWLCY